MFCQQITGRQLHELQWLLIHFAIDNSALPIHHQAVKAGGFYHFLSLCFKSLLKFLSELKEKFALLMDKSHKPSGRSAWFDFRETGLPVLCQHDNMIRISLIFKIFKFLDGKLKKYGFALVIPFSCCVPFGKPWESTYLMDVFVSLFFLKLIEPKPSVVRYLTVGFMDHICTVWAEPSNPVDLFSCTEVNRATINVETLL